MAELYAGDSGQLGKRVLRKHRIAPQFSKVHFILQSQTTGLAFEGQLKSINSASLSVYSIMRSAGALKMSFVLDRQILRILNGQAFSLGEVKLVPVSGYARLYERMLRGLPTPNVERQVSQTETVQRERRKLLATVLGWRSGSIPMPPSIRRCRHCAKFFLVESRANKLYCEPKTCGAYFRMRKKKRADRKQKLAKLRGAWMMCREPDRKFKAARKAGVTLKFVTSALTRKEIV
jgi:hypothetical protein